MKKILLKIILFLLLTNISVAQTSFSEKLSNATIELTHQSVKYDPTYFKIKYPNGVQELGIKKSFIKKML